MSSFAYTSYMANDRDLKGVLCLAYNLKKVGSFVPYIVILIEKVSDSVRQTLKHHHIRYVDWNLKQELQKYTSDERLIDAIISKHYYGKYLSFLLTEFDKVVYLDTDLLLMENTDAMFQLSTTQSQVYMVYDMQMFTDSSRNKTCLAMTTNGFNSGVIVYSPSAKIAGQLFSSLVEGGLDRFKTRLTDQCIFNQLHQSNVVPISPLHPKWNLSPSLVEDFIKKQFMSKPKIIHFMLKPKPWEILDGISEPLLFSSSISRHLYWIWCTTYQEMIQAHYFQLPTGVAAFADEYYLGQFVENGQLTIQSSPLDSRHLNEHS